MPFAASIIRIEDVLKHINLTSSDRKIQITGLKQYEGYCAQGLCLQTYRFQRKRLLKTISDFCFNDSSAFSLKELLKNVFLRMWIKSIELLLRAIEYNPHEL